MSLLEVQIDKSDVRDDAEQNCGVSVSDVVAFIGKRAATAVVSPSAGADHDDIVQEVALKLIKRDGDLDTIASTLQEGRMEVATNRVRNYAIDAARESADPGNSVFLKTLRNLNEGEPIQESQNVLGQAARRKAINYFNGLGASYEADEVLDVFGISAQTPGDEYGQPGNPFEYKEMLQILVDQVPSLQNPETASRNKKVVGMYLDGYPIPEIAKILGIPLGTTKTIWRQFRLGAENVLLANGYGPDED